MTAFSKEIDHGVMALGLCLPPGSVSQFARHGHLLIEENRNHNLTRISPEEMAEKHYLDSLTLLLVPEVKRAGKLVDISTGAGFPGIPIKIARPELKVTLVDSLRKRVRFLENVVNRLNLSEIVCYHSRAEDLGQDKAHREQYDVAVARAVAPLVSLVEYLLPLVKIGGVAVAMKGPAGADEATASAPAIGLLGGRLQTIMQTRLPRGDERQLVVIEKINATADKYPRRGGLAKKHPLV